MFKEYQSDVFKVLSNDPDLLKLLYHLPQNNNDNPLEKEDILSMENEKKWGIIRDRIKFTPVIRGLDNDPKCRVILYNANRKPQSDNRYNSIQQISFDVFAHADYNDVDMRMSMICDRIHELMFDKRITGLGKVEFESGELLGEVVKDYIGYHLTYKIGSGN